MRVIIVLLLNMSIIFGLNACIANSKVQVPLRFTLMVIDIPCKDVLSAVPTKLKRRDIPFAWLNKNKGLVSVGPLTEKKQLGSAYSMIRHTYQLSITCSNELSTSITGKTTLEGFNVDKKWIPITEIQTVQDVALKFLRSLGL